MSLTYCNRAIEGDYHIADEILEYLKQRLVNHIQITDKKYVECFKENGLERTIRLEMNER